MATILLSTLNIKCGLTCERSSDNSVLKIHFLFSFRCIISRNFVFNSAVGNTAGQYEHAK